MLTKIKKHSSTLLSCCAVTFGLLAGAQQAMADNCYIMVHGHGTQGDVKNGSYQPALDYWKDSHFDEYQNGNFYSYLIGPNDNYGVVGYDSTDESGFPYWYDQTAGEIARQMISIKQGNGDGFTHPESNTQCSANDTFYVVAHSQGALQMVYMSGNALPGSPNYNTTWTANETLTVDFESAFTNIDAIFTLGGAISGTEGADRVCNGNWLDSLINAAFLGKDCNASVEWMQTYDSYLARNTIGTNLAAPIYVMGGYKSFPGIEGASAGMLTGEDDGYINLASQMGCAGSAKRPLWDDLNQYKTFWGIAYGSPIFRCNNDNKGTPRTYNMASVYTDHDAERNAGIPYPDYTSIDNGMTCGNGQNMAGRIAACTE